MTTKTYNTTELQTSLADRLAATEWQPGRTFDGFWWGPGEHATRYYFLGSAEIRKNGKPVRGIRVWLEFDDAATLDGVSLRVQAPKAWYRSTLAKWHAEAVLIAIELVDPEEAARLRAEIAAAEKGTGKPIGDMVRGED